MPAAPAPTAIPTPVQQIPVVPPTTKLEMSARKPAVVALMNHAYQRGLEDASEGEES